MILQEKYNKRYSLASIRIIVIMSLDNTTTGASYPTGRSPETRWRGGCYTEDNCLKRIFPRIPLKKQEGIEFTLIR